MLRPLCFYRSLIPAVWGVGADVRGLGAEVESREAIKPRLSQLDLDVRISTHLAPDILSLRFCSCDDSHGSFHVLLQGF
jgi:hypothetical protein